MARIFGAGRAQVGKLGRMAEEADPLALLNQAVEDGVASIQNAKKGLENYRALILSVQRQVESGEKEKARLEARIQAAVDAGDPNQTAREYAMVLADVEQHLAANREQLAKHKETYENFAKQVEIGQAGCAKPGKRPPGSGLELEQSKREKEMAQFARDFSFDPAGIEHRSGPRRGTDLPEDRRQPRRRRGGRRYVEAGSRRRGHGRRGTQSGGRRDIGTLCEEMSRRRVQCPNVCGKGLWRPSLPTVGRVNTVKNRENAKVRKTAKNGPERPPSRFRTFVFARISFFAGNRNAGLRSARRRCAARQIGRTRTHPLLDGSVAICYCVQYAAAPFPEHADPAGDRHDHLAGGRGRRLGAGDWSSAR